MELRQTGKEYNNMVDLWVAEHIKGGTQSFERLLMSLPAVDPITTAGSLRRLSRKNQIARRLLTETKESKSHAPTRAGITELPIPHPLDFDWRFSTLTISDLLHRCAMLTRKGDTIALIGVPTLFFSSRRGLSGRKMILIDKNHNSGTTDHSGRVININLAADYPKGLQADLVVVDPPWYTDYQLRFIWIASGICVIGGKVLVVFPKAGTRPGIQSDNQRILDYCETMSLGDTGAECEVRYVTPYFERNAIKQSGILSPFTHWRSADLKIFVKQRKTPSEEPKCKLDSWDNESYLGFRIKSNPDPISAFRNPTLKSVIPGDILPSVSRRDSRRERANVWTRGNRIYSSNGVHILREILKAMSLGSNPVDAVSRLVLRRLNKRERGLIENTVSSLKRIIDLEEQEIRELQ
jgi:hypothetical protein